MYSPMPWLSRCGGKACAMMAVALARIIANPAACTTRSAITASIVGASPSSRLDRVNTPYPSR